MINFALLKKRYKNITLTTIKWSFKASSNVLAS